MPGGCDVDKASEHPIWEIVLVRLAIDCIHMADGGRRCAAPVASRASAKTNRKLNQAQMIRISGLSSHDIPVRSALALDRLLAAAVCCCPRPHTCQPA